jgi:hypothetical protein
MFVPSLFEGGAIKENMFSMYIDQADVSKIQYGGYDLKKYAQEPITWFDITTPTFWSLEFQNVKIGGTPFRPSTTKIMADTGTSLNMIPDEDFYKIKDLLFSDWKCRVEPNTLTICDCTEETHKTVPDITFDIKGKELVIDRDMWFERKGGECVIKFMHAPGRGEWILGVNFFQNYYSVMDYTTKRIGLAKSINFKVPHKTKFIDWALSGSATLLNLNQISEKVTNITNQFEFSSQVTAITIFMSILMFAVYAYIIKKRQAKKVKATVIPDEDHRLEYLRTQM